MLKFNFYHNRKDNFYSNKVERETAGLIGYIRGDFGSGGNSFHHSWFENKGKLNNEVFKEDLNKVMEFLRERMLTDRMYMRSVVYGNPNAKIDSKESTSYGVFVETDGYEYDIRAIDRDKAGDKTVRRIGEELDEMNYKWERILPENKDWNEDLICEKEQAENFSMTM